jgi:eukaryotic-like serine/threonine-protein kinase
MGEEVVSESARRISSGGGRYRILAELGRGGMANVYLAVARGPIGFNKLCVLKALRGSLADEPEAVAMFVNEARLAARLNHANVVQTYEVVEDGGRHLMVMEYLEGQSLAEIFGRCETQAKERRLPLAMHLQILTSTLAGLHYAHELADFDGRPLGIVHRDVSPHNALVCFDGHVKVLDFGIAKVLAGSTTATKTGVIKGKVRYMAPEQMAGEAVDRRADIFGVGVMLWEAIAGVHIWKGMIDNAVIAAISRGDIPAPRSRDSDVPANLVAICKKAMSFDRADRYATAAEMEAELDAELRRLGGPIKAGDIGAFVSELFAARRERTKATLEAAMRGDFVPGEDELPLLRSDMHRTGDTRTSAVLASNERSRKRRVGFFAPPWLLAVLGVVALALATLVTVGSFRALAPRGGATVSPAVQVATSKVSVRATPPDATILLDGAAVGNPFLGTFTRDATEHHLRIARAGYASSNRLVRFDEGEIGLDVSLEPLPADEAPSAPPPSALSPSPPPNERPETLPPSKSPPKLDVRKAPPSSSTATTVGGGFLTLDTYPWTRVSEDGRDLGVTPLVHLALPAGAHMLTLENRDQGIKQSYAVTVPAGETVSKRLELK